MDTLNTLFVYGTLKQGHLNHILLRSLTRQVLPASVCGQLYDCGLFPALAPGDGIVRGELVYLEPDAVNRALAVCDNLEGYNVEDENGSTYLRRIVRVITEDGREEQAYAYLYNDGHPDLPPIASFPSLAAGEWPGPRVDTAVRENRLHAYTEHVRGFVQQREGEP